MLKSINTNRKIKIIFIFGIFIIIFIAYNLIDVIKRVEASAIDSERIAIEQQITRMNNEVLNIQNVILRLQELHNLYKIKMEEKKNLTIDSTILQTSASTYFDMLNTYYDNKIFKIVVLNIESNNKYVNLADVRLKIEFHHAFGQLPELAKKIEGTILELVHDDIETNHSTSLNILKNSLQINSDENIIKFTYIKRK